MSFVSGGEGGEEGGEMGRGYGKYQNILIQVLRTTENTVRCVTFSYIYMLCDTMFIFSVSGFLKNIVKKEMFPHALHVS